MAAIPSFILDSFINPWLIRIPLPSNSFLHGSVYGLLLGIAIVAVKYHRMNQHRRAQLQHLQAAVTDAHDDLLKALSMYSIQCRLNEDLEARMRDLKLNSDATASTSQSDSLYEVQGGHNGLIASNVAVHRLQFESQEIRSEWDQGIVDLTINNEAMAQAVQTAESRMAVCEHDMLKAQCKAALLQTQIEEQRRAYQKTLETDRHIIVALQEELEHAAIDSQARRVDELHHEAANFRQAFEDLQGSLEFVLAEQRCSVQMYEDEISRLRVELSQTRQVCEHFQETVRFLQDERTAPAQLQNEEPEDQQNITNTVAALIAERDEAQAHLEDLTNSTLALVQAYTAVQVDRDTLLAQLRRLREVCAHCQSPTPGAGFAFAMPLGCSPSRSPTASPLVATPDIDSATIIQPVNSASASCASPDVFGPHSKVGLGFLVQSA